jgi:hypothetical protein
MNMVVNKKYALYFAIVISIICGFSPPTENTDNAWITAIVNNLDVSDYYLAIDVDGNLIVTGCFIDKAKFGTKSLVSVGNYDIFLAKYRRDGSLLWLRQAGGKDFDMANIIKTDTVGNIYLTGYFTGTSFFDNYIIKSRAQRNAFTAKYDKSGKLLWVQAEGAEIYSEISPVKRKRFLARD